MRIRTIKPEFWQDEVLASLPIPVRLLFVGLWNMADDHGRFNANPVIVKAALFPYDARADVKDWLRQLHEAGRIQLYGDEKHQYGAVRNFAKHQRIDKRAESRLPCPPDVSARLSGEMCGARAEVSGARANLRAVSRIRDLGSSTGDLGSTAAYSSDSGSLSTRTAVPDGTEDLDRLDMRAGFRRIAQGGGA